LFFDYVYEVRKVDEILTIKDWGGVNGNSGSVGARSSSSTPTPAPNGELNEDGHDEEKVLVVEACGVADNEVLARAWCSHWGLSAVIADVERTW
jgi:hypothetical protein